MKTEEIFHVFSEEDALDLSFVFKDSLLFK